jgi:chemotaxis protein MotB
MSVHFEEKSEGAPEYMVSYADMITIMMSFFVIMFALSQGREEQEAAIESIGHRFSPAWRPWNVQSSEPGESHITAPVEPRLDNKGPHNGRANIPSRGWLGGLGGSIFFEESTVDLAPEQQSLLKRIADGCAGKPQKIQVLGHTTNRPLPEGSPYHDHWDLAYARSRAVMERLVKLGIPAERIRLSVAGNTEPANPADAFSAARLDSRVDISLLDVFVTDFSPAFNRPGASH